MVASAARTRGVRGDESSLSSQPQTQDTQTSARVLDLVGEILVGKNPTTTDKLWSAKNATTRRRMGYGGGGIGFTVCRRSGWVALVEETRMTGRAVNNGSGGRLRHSVGSATPR